MVFIVHYYFDVLKKYAVFSGRASRKEYWMFMLFQILIAMPSVLIVGLIGSNVSAATNSTYISFLFYLYDALLVLYALYILATFIPSIAVAVRRLHDTNRSGWWYLIIFTYIGAIVFLVFSVQDSQLGENKYGPNPKGVQASVAPQV